MPQGSRSRYYKFRVKTKSGKTRTGIRLASSPKTAHSAVSRNYKQAKSVRVFKTPAYKLK